MWTSKEMMVHNAQNKCVRSMSEYFARTRGKFSFSPIFSIDPSETVDCLKRKFLAYVIYNSTVKIKKRNNTICAWFLVLILAIHFEWNFFNFYSMIFMILGFSDIHCAFISNRLKLLKISLTMNTLTMWNTVVSNSLKRYYATHRGISKMNWCIPALNEFDGNRAMI